MDGIQGYVDTEAYLGRLTPSQREAATRDGPVLVLAGAGTGKTTALTSAAAWRMDGLGIAPSRILAVTFTNKAAGEMRARIKAIRGDGETPRWIGTFHQLAGWQMREHPGIAGLKSGFDIVDAGDAQLILKRVMGSLGVNTRKDTEDRRHEALEDMAKTISKLKDAIVAPVDVDAAVDRILSRSAVGGKPVDSVSLELARTIYPEYQRALTEANCADFGDLLLWPTRMLRGNEDYRQMWAGRFDAVLADEYQDVNHVQYHWLRLLSSDHRRLFVVGDDDQAIFSWRGSDITYIQKFREDYPESSVVRLEDNFRSTSHIVEAANSVIARNPSRIGKTLVAHRGDGHRIEILRFHNGRDETVAIVDEIKARKKEGGTWDRFAILYRNNFLSRGFEEALRRARIPYTILGDVSFWQRAEIKDALAYLKLSLSGGEKQSDEAFRRVVNSPKRGLGDVKMIIIEKVALTMGCSLLDALPHATLAPSARRAADAFAAGIAASRNCGDDLGTKLSFLVDACGYRKMLRDSKSETSEGCLKNIDELVIVASGFETSQELFDHAALDTRSQDAEDAGKVRLMTLHKAKGLEFSDVFLPGWEEGLFPSARSDIYEERRLAYVALTRGRDSVTVSSSEYRFANASPSPFLKEIPACNTIKGWRRDIGRVPPPARHPDPPPQRRMIRMPEPDASALPRFG